MLMIESCVRGGNKTTTVMLQLFRFVLFFEGEAFIFGGGGGIAQ